MSTNEIRVMTPEDQDIDAAYQRALAAREESAASDIDAAYQRALAAREASGVPPMQVVGGRFSNRSPEMDRFFAGDPAALFPEASREQLAYALGHDPEKNNYWMVQKLGVSQYLGNIYGVPASAVANDFKTYTKAYFGEEIEDPHIAFGRIRELREGREGNTAGTAGRRGYDLAIGMESVGKGIYDVAGVGSGVLAKANAALNSVYFPLAWAADKAGFPETAAEMRANAGKDVFFTELHRCYRDISDNFRREIAVLSKERGADETFFGEVAGGVLQNLPNLLVAFGTSGMTAPALPKALAGAPGLSRYLPRLTKYLTPLSRIEAADLYFMATSGASEWMDTADDPAMSAAGRVSNALVVGAAEAAFNHLGVMSVYKRWFGNGRITREGAERFASNWIKSVIDSGKEIGVDIVKEGASEVATGLVQRMSRLIVGQNGQSLSRMSYSEIFHALLDEAPLEFSVGAATAGAIGSAGFAGRVRQKVNLAEYEGYLSDNLRQTRDRIAELEEQEKRKPLTPDEVAEKETLQQAIAENNPFAIAVAENARIKREAERQARFDDMTPEEISADAVRELKEMQAAERRQAVRKTEEAALPDSPEQLTRRAFEAAVAEYPNLDAAIVGEETELPEHLRQRITSRGYTGGVEGVYDENSGRIWLVAGNVPSSRVGKVLLHEAVGHKSLRELFGVKYDSFLLRLAADHEQEIATLAEARGIDFSTEAGKLEAADEFMAQLAETRLAAGMKPKLLARFRLFLRRIGFLRNTSFSDDELTALLARAYGRARAGGEAGRGQARSGTEEETRFALRDFPEEAQRLEAGRLKIFTDNYRQILEEFDAGTLPRDRQIELGETPDALTMLGVEQLPISMSGSLLYKAREKHGLTTAELKQIPEALYNPVMIFDSSDRSTNFESGMVVLTQIRDKDGKPVIIALNLGKGSKRHQVNDIASIHGRRVKNIVDWIDEGLLRYSHKKRALAFARFHRLQLPKKATLSERNSDIIIDESPNVKPENEKTNDSGNGIRFSIAPVWTGSAADYDRPSLHYIGTGEGAQAYGWGLYGSSDRGIATGYAERDVKNKFKQPSMKINGETFTQGNSAALTGKEEWFGVLLQHLYSVNGNRKQAAKNIRDGIRRLRNLAKSETDGKELEFYQAMISDLKRAADFLADEGNTVEYDGGRNIYKQTFWPDKEENLLDWDEPVPPEQMQQIADQAVKEQLPFGYTEDGKNFFNGSGTSGELLYKDLAKSFNLGSPKAVSEFLYRAGIDGITYIGDASGVRNYVAFSDQDIRVDDHLRFSVSPEHQAKVELMARAVLDRAETAASPEEIMELLNRRGVEIDDIELARQVWIEARETARERNRIIERNRMRDYIRNSDPWIAVLEDVYGSEFHIKPGRKYRDEEFGANHQTGWIDNRKKAGSGIAPDEAAATLSRQFGEEITDDDVIDHFRNLRRSDFTKMRRRDSAELRRLEKEQENLANEVLLDSLREGGVLLDDTLIRNYPQAARQFAREIMPKETPPGEADPIDWQAVKAAQQQQENDMRGYAAGYSQGRAEGEQAGRERLKQARQAFQERYRKKNDDWRKLLKQVRDDRNNIRDVQKLARAFVVNHLPMEERGKFLPQVEKLSTYSGVPTPKHPEGRRNAELEALMSRIMEAEKEYSRNRNIQAIKDMLEAVRVKRNRRGIPVSVVPEIQQTVDRIREIVNMNVPAVNNLISAHNEEIAELEKKHVQSDRLELLRNDNELLVTFGKLKEQVPEDVRAARELLYHLIRDGRDSLRSRLDARLAEVEAMREQAITEASRGTNVYGKTDADLNFAGMLPQMGLHSLLDIASGSEGADFDRTVAGRLFRKVEESTQREATANRKLQQDFEAFLKGVGVDSRIKKNAFFTMLDRKEEQTGVFRLQYFQESGNKEHPITELGRRPSIRKALSIERARKLVAEYDENGTLSPEFLQQLFKETDLAAYEIPPASIDFLRKQLADFDSGLQQEYEIFGDEADDAELNELRRRFQKGESVVLILPDPSTGYREIEQELSPGSALQVLLTWEQPHYRAGMEWNGWSEKSIEQLRAYLGRHPEVLALGSWMRDYIKQQRPELDRAARDRYGAGLPELENYWPGSFRESLTDAVAPQNGIGGRSYGTMSINPSFLIGRKFQLFDVDTNTSALSVFLTNQIESQHFIAWHETIRDLRSVFGSSKVQKTLRTHYGEKFRQQLVKSIDALANGGGDRALATQFLSNLYRYWVPAKIAVNSASVAKQMAGVISYMNDVPPSQFFKYFFGSSKRFNAEFAEWVEWAKGTDYVKNRMAGGLDKDLIYLMNYTRDSKSYNPISDAMIEYGTLPTRLADLWATLHGGYAVFKYHYDQALKHGTDERSAWNYAALRWQRATDETQQSGYQKDLNEYQRNAGAYRYLTTFLTNPIQVMNLELQTLNQLRFGADKGEARSKLARQVLVNHIMLPTLMVGITEFFRHGTEWDEYEWEDFFASWLLGPFEGAFIIGKVLAGALNLGADIAVGRSARPRALFQALPVIDEAMLSAYSLYRTLAKEKPFEADDYLKMLKNIGDIGVLGGTAAAPVGAAGTIISAFTREIRRFRRLFAGQQQ